MLAQQKTAGLCTKRTVGSRQLGLRPSRPSSRAVFCPKASQQQQQSAHENQLESISKALRIPGSKSLGPVAKAIKNSQNILTKQRKQIEADFAPGKEVRNVLGMRARSIMQLLMKQGLMQHLFTILGGLMPRSFKVDMMRHGLVPTQVPDKQRECLSYVGVAEEAMVKGMPFEVPKEYANLPQLLMVWACTTMLARRVELKLSNLCTALYLLVLKLNPTRHALQRSFVRSHNASPSSNSDRSMQGRATLEMKINCGNGPEGSMCTPRKTVWPAPLFVRRVRTHPAKEVLGRLRSKVWVPLQARLRVFRMRKESSSGCAMGLQDAQSHMD
eukprot:1160569-Pelagomonas_calceolata.AAC.11